MGNSCGTFTAPRNRAFCDGKLVLNDQRVKRWGFLRIETRHTLWAIYAQRASKTEREKQCKLPLKETMHTPDESHLKLSSQLKLIKCLFPTTRRSIIFIYSFIWVLRRIFKSISPLRRHYGDRKPVRAPGKPTTISSLLVNPPNDMKWTWTHSSLIVDPWTPPTSFSLPVYNNPNV